MTAGQSGDVREVLGRTVRFCFCSGFWVLVGSQPVPLQIRLALCRRDSRARRCWLTSAGLPRIHTGSPERNTSAFKAQKRGLIQDSILVFRGFYFLSVSY